MLKYICLIACLHVALHTVAQHEVLDRSGDSIAHQILQEVLVKAYAQNRKLIDVSASIGLLDEAQLARFGNLSILPALNTIPGVRMEERSPASYRLNFRGSSLRSPFGVRDVKIYFNEIPLTDPSGNTYLNGLGIYNFNSIELIKGPAGSLYGAGIGGALLIQSMPAYWQKEVRIDYTASSFVTNNVNGMVRWGDSSHQNQFNYNHQSSNGYRAQSKMRRDIASWETLLKATQKQSLHAYIFYSDLYYQTPGGLTAAEYITDPQAARPKVGTTPGAIQNQAAINQKTFLAGLSNQYQLCPSWQNTTSFYGSYTDFINPGIRVYEIRKEPHFGGRTMFDYKKQFSSASLQVDFGAEGQKGFFATTDFANMGGNPGASQTNAYINNWQYMIFLQANIAFRAGWILTVGASSNKSSIQFNRLSSSPSILQSRIFEDKIAPRIALLKTITPRISVYGSAGRGFSTPTVSELLTSAGVIGLNLQPEDGIDYELGLRGNLFGNKLYFDINSFFFHIHNAIVQRIDTSNVYYYLNAGSTRQNGLETYISYQLIDRPRQTIRGAKIWVSHTWHDFHYNNFMAVNSQSPALVDYSGQQLPGVPPQALVTGFDLSASNGLYINLTDTYCERIALNDANTSYAGSYNLLGARIGLQTMFGTKRKMNLYAGVDNLFNVTYSLGNDFNAAVGRYFNGAAGINYFIGVSLQNLLP